MLLQGLIAAITILWLLSYFGFRRVFGYAAFVDIAVTGGFMVMFAGSFGGMMTGLIAGLMVSIILKFGGRVFGKERARIARLKGNLLPSIVWMRVEDK
jgi:hypothetical protein